MRSTSGLRSLPAPRCARPWRRSIRRRARMRKMFHSTPYLGCRGLPHRREPPTLGSHPDHPSSSKSRASSQCHQGPPLPARPGTKRPRQFRYSGIACRDNDRTSTVLGNVLDRSRENLGSRGRSNQTASGARHLGELDKEGTSRAIRRPEPAFPIRRSLFRGGPSSIRICR